MLDAAYDSGLSGPGRLHDLFVAGEAVTPGAFKRRGEGLTIAYGFHPSPFGECLLATTERGLCWLGFTLADGREATLTELKRRWPRAVVRADSRATAGVLERVFPDAPPGAPLTLLPRGTNFQIKVWEALLRIPPGAVVSYEGLAVHLGSPAGARAVAGAVAANPIAFVIPCHRVIRKTGAFHRYAYGTARKRAMLAWEAARFAKAVGPGGDRAYIAAS